MNRFILPFALLACLGACGGTGDPGDGDDDIEGNGDGTVIDGHDGSPISDPADFCDGLAQAVCYKLIACFTAEERAAEGLAATEEECLAMAQGLCSPDTVCEAGLTYQPDLAGACLVEVEALTCDDARDPTLVEPGPSCVEMCQ
jgi:hypothetical protein